MKEGLNPKTSSKSADLSPLIDDRLDTADDLKRAESRSKAQAALSDVEALLNGNGDRTLSDYILASWKIDFTNNSVSRRSY